MKLVTLIAVSLLVVVLLAALWAARLPRSHEAHDRRLVRAPDDVVRAVLADVESQVRWRQGVARVERHADGTFSEFDASGRETRFRPRRDAEPDVVLDFEGDGFRGEFRASLAVVAEGTNVSVSETVHYDGAVSAVLGAIFFDVDRFVTQWLHDLERECVRRHTATPRGPSDPSQAR